MKTSGDATAAQHVLSAHAWSAGSVPEEWSAAQRERDLELLERVTTMMHRHVVDPAFAAPAGLPRLMALSSGWLTWPNRFGAGAIGALLELVLHSGRQTKPIRERLLQLDDFWRCLLKGTVLDAVRLEHLRRDLDVDQFAYELCSIYLSHALALQLARDPLAKLRAERTLDKLIHDSLPVSHIHIQNDGTGRHQ